MKIIAVRHGGTDANAERRLQGQRLNLSLSTEGHSQVESTRDQLKPHSFAAIYSSPLKRAKETAEIIAANWQQKVMTHPYLKERKFGELSGVHVDELTPEQRALVAPNNTTYDLEPYGGESHQAVRERVEKFIEELKRKHSPTDQLLVITHVGIIRIFYEMAVQKKPEEIPCASIHRFEL